MKKSILLIFLLMAATAAFTQNEMSFVVEGYSPYYNQVRIVNETSFSNFHCRLVYQRERRCGYKHRKQKRDFQRFVNGYPIPQGFQ